LSTEKTPSTSSSLFCPVCGAGYPASVVYCREDGTRLEGIEKYVLASLDDEEPAKAIVAARAGGRVVGRRHGRRFVISVLFIVFFCLAGYLYLRDHQETAGRIEKEVDTALKTRGFDVTAHADDKGTVTLAGSVKTDADRNGAVNIAKSHKQVKGIIDNVKVTPSPEETERTLNKALDAAGLPGVESRVDGNFRVVLSGVARNEGEVVLATKTVKAYPEVKGTRNMVRVEKAPASGKNVNEGDSFTETRQFSLPGLSPSSWASLKYRNVLPFRVPGPGRLIVEASWEPEGTLALILNNANTGATHVQKDGTSPLKLSYRVTSGDFAKGPMWEATIANFAAHGPRKGVLKVTFETGAASGRMAFDAAGTAKELNQTLKSQGIYTVTAEISKDGTATLKGSAPTNEAKERALAIARRFKSVKVIKDIIFVVGS
jgi:osmotically-inducible protein OsmY